MQINTHGFSVLKVVPWKCIIFLLKNTSDCSFPAELAHRRTFLACHIFNAYKCCLCYSVYMLLPDRSRVLSHQGAMWCVWGFYDIDSYVTASFFTAYVCTENSSALTKLSLKVLLRFVLFYTFYCHSLLEALKMYPRLRLDTDLKGFVLVSCCLWWQCVASDSLMPCMKVIMWGGGYIVCVMEEIVMLKLL